MSSSREFVSTKEAARILGVTVQHVRRLADGGELTRIARGLIDRASLDRYLSDRQGGRTRVWAEPTAWGAIALLSGDIPSWLGPVQTSRLRGSLRDITDPDDLVVRTRERAKVHTFSGHPTAVSRLLDAMAVPYQGLIGVADALDHSHAEGYLAASTLDATVRFLGLHGDPDGKIIVRATKFNFDIVMNLAPRSAALAALDAAASLDPRVRGVGEGTLTEILDSFRR